MFQNEETGLFKVGDLVRLKHDSFSLGLEKGSIGVIVINNNRIPIKSLIVVRFFNGNIVVVPYSYLEKVSNG